MVSCVGGGGHGASHSLVVATQRTTVGIVKSGCFAWIVTRKYKYYLTTSRLLQLVQLEGELSGQELNWAHFKIKFEAEITVVCRERQRDVKKKFLSLACRIILVRILRTGEIWECLKKTVCTYVRRRSTFTIACDHDNRSQVTSLSDITWSQNFWWQILRPSAIVDVHMKTT